MQKLLQINDLMSECGYGYMDESGVNNSYNCSHCDCGESEWTFNNIIVDLDDFIRPYLLKRIEGKKSKIRKRLIRKYWKYRFKNEDKLVKKFGLKTVGRCHTFTCPIASPADLESMFDLDRNLYDEYKEDADSEGYIESDWMVING